MFGHFFEFSANHVFLEYILIRMFSFLQTLLSCQSKVERVPAFLHQLSWMSAQGVVTETAEVVLPALSLVTVGTGV